jgi:glucose/arabinose dehydrogenase
MEKYSPTITSWHFNCESFYKTTLMLKNILLIFLLLGVKGFYALAQPALTYTELINSGLNTPVDIVTANDGSNRVFIAEQGGIIKVYSYNSSHIFTLVNNSFLNISAEVSGDSEQGLLSLVFHPAHASNRYFYVYYTNGQGGISVDRYQTLLANPNQADVSSKTNIITIQKPVAFTNHNGGKLNFGSDGYLYFGLGDGGSGGDPRNFAQRGDSLWGKMVRIDINNTTTSPPLNYAIPADNPYAGSTTVLNEIYSFGLRNPWRWSFDKLNGNIWIADVGQGAREEVNLLTPAQANGANYGWRCYEGSIAYNTSGCLPASGYTAPVFDYTHNFTTGGFSITGGYVYRGSLKPALYGYYIFSDFVSGNVWVMNATTLAVTQQPTALPNVAGFGELEDGEIVALSRNGLLYHVSTNSVLPLKLLNFTGYANNNYTQLNWQTAAETQVKHFEVEYSADGITFKNAGIVAAKNQVAAAYGFRHYIQNNITYYRLKMVNDNGVAAYSDIIPVKNAAVSQQPVIYSFNGNSRMIWLNIAGNKKTAFQLFTVNGQVVYSTNNYQNNAIIDLQNIAAGIYVGKIITNENVVSEKIIVR